MYVIIGKVLKDGILGQFIYRPTYDQYSILLKEHQLCNSLLYVNYMRMDSTCFEELLSLVGPKLVRLCTRPDCLSIGEILSTTVRLKCN